MISACDISQVILDCTLMMDLEYVMVNPTFHHWQTGNKRYGLTFQTSLDAHMFEQSLRTMAYETVKQHRKRKLVCSFLPITDEIINQSDYMLDEAFNIINSVLFFLFCPCMIYIIQWYLIQCNSWVNNKITNTVLFISICLLNYQVHIHVPVSESDIECIVVIYSIHICLYLLLIKVMWNKSDGIGVVSVEITVGQVYYSC